MPALDFTVTLINPPHTAIGSRIPNDHLPPLGLLCVGGALLDIGCRVKLIDADLSNDSLDVIVARTHVSHDSQAPQFIMLGHSGSSTVHETVLVLCQKLKNAMPNSFIVYGGVYPTYHYDEILQATDNIDVIVRGEGEKTNQELMQAIANQQPLTQVNGLAFTTRTLARLTEFSKNYLHLSNAQKNKLPVVTLDEKADIKKSTVQQSVTQDDLIVTDDAVLIKDLNQYRVGWELIDFADYSYWGGKRAVVVQFSRGCPYLCNYCGQRGFWTRWRHRDPVAFAKELAWLHREHGVEVINFADELPTGSKKMWRAFLEALIAENVSLLLVGSTRAGDIVRDKEILHLYKKAGVIRFLLGIESYDESTIAKIQKGGNVAEDKLAIELLRQHGIIAMATYVVGFENETDKDFWQSFKHLLMYDPDQIQLLYATPHRWTPFYDEVGERRVILADTKRWDYKHQVFLLPNVPAWRVFMWFKAIEVLMQTRPKVIKRMLTHPMPEYRQAMRWYSHVGKKVWFHEIIEFIFVTKHLKNPPTLNEFLGQSLSAREYALKTKATQS